MVETNGATPDWDILPKMAKYYDKYMLFPLVNNLDDSDDKDKALFAILKDSKMVDFVADLDARIRGADSASPEWQQKKQAVVDRAKTLEEQAEKILTLLDDESVVSNLRGDKESNMKYLAETHDVKPEDLESMYDWGRFEYESGNYSNAAEVLRKYRILSNDTEKVNSASWGMLASFILSTDWEGALAESRNIRENLIDVRLFNSPLAQLQARTWMIHWLLFPYFNDADSIDSLTELLFQPAYINTIQVLCPWILRFLTVQVVTGRQRPAPKMGNFTHQKQLKDLIRIVRQEGYEYHDPATDFIKALYVDFDFEEAQKMLTEAGKLFEEDFFLSSSKDAFMDCARHLISSEYCKIHSKIDINDLSTRLGLSGEEGEKWIVNLIRDTRIGDAKIDYQAGVVNMNHPPQSVYQQVIERTKGGFFRTQVLSSAVGR